MVRFLTNSVDQCPVKRLVPDRTRFGISYPDVNTALHSATVRRLQLTGADQLTSDLQMTHPPPRRLKSSTPGLEGPEASPALLASLVAIKRLLESINICGVQRAARRTVPALILAGDTGADRGGNRSRAASRE